MGSLRIGDRIRLIAMSDEPDPIEPDSTGMVTGVIRHGEGREMWLQIDVDWDDGRMLMLVSPPDRFETANTECSIVDWQVYRNLLPRLGIRGQNEQR